MKASWTSPSNIALVKYWGKFGEQMPKNPSLSFTLKHSTTTLSLEAHKKTDGHADLLLTFLFEGQKNLKFSAKIEKFLNSQISKFPWLKTHSLLIESKILFLIHRGLLHLLHL